MLVYTIIEKSTGKLYDGKGDANEKCKKIQGFFSRFYSFSGTDVHSGFCGCQDRKSTRLNSSHKVQSRMPSSA